MRSICFLAAVSLLAGSFLQGQVKGSFLEKSACGIATVHQTVLIDDGRQHSVSLDQRPCTSKEPIQIGGLTGTEYVAYGVDDVQNGHSIDRGYVVGTMKNGDRYFLKYEGTATMKGNVPEHLEGKWNFTGGSGQLKELRGEGTYSARPTTDGGMEFVIEGNYELR
jgi:hypothetical protein